MKKKPRFYIDTSVAGGYFDAEFSKDTKDFFARARKGEFILIVSSLFEYEIADAPAQVRNLVSRFKKKYVKRISHTHEAEVLAENYLLAKVVGKTSVQDCRHIPLATVCRADVLVS